MTYIAARVKEITKINKWDIIKNFCTAEETINKMKRQPSEWEKIIANEAIDKGLTSKIYVQLDIRKTNPIKKGQKTQTDISPKIFRWLTNI